MNFAPSKGMTSYLLVTWIVYSVPAIRVYSIFPHSFLKFGIPAVLIQTMKCSFSTSAHWVSSLFWPHLNFFSLSVAQAIPSSFIGMFVAPWDITYVSLKYDNATSPHGLTGYSSTIYVKGVPSHENNFPAYWLVIRGSQSIDRSGYEGEFPASWL